jgi:hypothetical protein
MKPLLLILCIVTVLQLPRIITAATRPGMEATHARDRIELVRALSAFRSSVSALE